MNKDNGISLPPHDEDAEMSVLGSMVLDNNVIPGVRQILTAGDFYASTNREIHKVIIDLYDAGSAVDIVTLRSALLQAGRFEAVGGMEYLTRVAECVPSAASAPHYAALVKKCSSRRRLLKIGNQIAKAVQEGADEETLRGLAEEATSLLQQECGNADPWECFTLRDAYAPRPPQAFIVEGLFAEGSLNIVYSAPGKFKSMLLADMACCVAVGKEWLTGAGRKTKQDGVIWIDFDNGRRRTHERFEALGRGHDLPENAPLYYYSMASPRLNGGDIVAMRNLAARIKDRGAALVVIDNLTVIQGDADENSAEMAKVMANFRWLAEETNAAIVLIHHERKSKEGKTRAGEALRGHSSIEGLIDLALVVERDDLSQTARIQSTKTRGDDVLPFGARFEFEHKPATQELAWARFHGVEVEDTKSDGAVRKAIVEVVREHRPVNEGKLAKHVQEVLPDVGVNRIREIAKGMSAEGKQIKATTGKHGARLYDLA